MTSPEASSHRLAAARYLLNRFGRAGGEFPLPPTTISVSPRTGEWTITNDGVHAFLAALSQIAIDALFEGAEARGIESDAGQREFIRGWLAQVAEYAVISAAEAELEAPPDPGSALTGS